MRRSFFSVLQIQPKPTAEIILLSVILVIQLLIAVSLLSQKGLFIDDSIHIPAGYSYLLTHDYRLNQEHPPFIKLLSAVGLWRLQPRFPFDSSGWEQAATPGDPKDGMERIEEAFFDVNAPQFERISFWGRMPVIVLPMILGVVVWWFGRQLFGPIAGLVAAILSMTEPNILGNSIVVQNDIAAALALLLFVVALRKYLANNGPVIALALGAALGFALIAKYSLVVLLPLSFLLIVVNGAVRVIRRHSSLISSVTFSSLVFFTSYLILLAAYSFHADRIDEDESFAIGGWFYLSGHLAELSHRFLLWLPPLLPKYFVYGITMVVEDSREGRPAFLLGQVSNKGWWYYFPVAFALKTTLPFLISSVLGICWAAVRVLKEKRPDLLYVVLPPVLYLAMSMTSHLNIGVRHILPIFPFCAMAGGGFVSAGFDFNRRLSRALAVTCIAIVLCSSGIIAMLTFPNYLTYFSPLAGGPSRGWKVLSDSNVETGQEVKTLARYLKDHGENRVAGVMIGGEFLKFYGIQAYDLPGWEEDDGVDEQDDIKEHDNKPVPDENTKTEGQLTKNTSGTADSGPKYVAIGAWYMLQIGLSPRQRQVIDMYVNQTPEAMIGNSIFVFRRH
jgi:4-amino-4-deoxy-L-arabinose transferase-like glycosyltransferase